ncbi:FAD-dependent monooxygenase [Streptomyces lutosisoli]|uniref:FAD-dependent monooxygenase n=1 Tax=Streptomyces lutosisoli TaxID=2665721 RepID=A0ABW2VKS7_9ACTN
MNVPVIIVGAGPAGLMLAGELRLAGVEVIVLERLAQPSGESRGIGFTARTLESFDQRGILSRFDEIGRTTGGHFGSIPLDYGVVDDSHRSVTGIPQSYTERMLSDWATGLGAQIRRGWELTALHDDGDGVDIEVATPEGTRRLRTAYLVGCDGGRSAVRKLAGFEFPGTEPTMELLLADIRGCELRPRMSGERSPHGIAMVAPIADGITRIVALDRGNPPRSRTQPPSYEEVAATFERLTGEDIRHGEPVWVSAFGDGARQVSEYRRGRVLLAGDAAHVHLPAGGQGMNVSIQDSVNLGWKLAAVVNGWGPADLLDSYHSERHPVGARMLMHTRAQGLLALGGPEIEPLRYVLSDLIASPDVSRRLAAAMSGLEVSYEMGAAGHPLVGLRMPKVDLVTPAGLTSSTELLHEGRGLLLDLGDDPAVRKSADGWRDRVDVVVGKPQQPFDDAVLNGTASVLIRPDGYVAWAAPGSGTVQEALVRWFGETN